MKIALLGLKPTLPLQIPEGSHIHQLFLAQEQLAITTGVVDLSILNEGCMPKGDEIIACNHVGSVESMLKTVRMNAYDAAFVTTEQSAHVSLAMLSHELVAVNVAHEDYYKDKVPFVAVQEATGYAAFLIIRTDCRPDDRRKLSHYAYLLARSPLTPVD